MLTFLRNLVANSSTISKFLVSIASSVTVALTTHSWTNVPTIMSYVFSALVYLVPNLKAAPATPAAAPPGSLVLSPVPPAATQQ